MLAIHQAWGEVECLNECGPDEARLRPYPCEADHLQRECEQVCWQTKNRCVGRIQLPVCLACRLRPVPLWETDQARVSVSPFLHGAEVVVGVQEPTNHRLFEPRDGEELDLAVGDEGVLLP